MARVDGELCALRERVAAAVAKHAGCGAQIALARDGELLAFESFGRAPVGGAEREVEASTLFCVFSVSKAIVSSAVWILLQEGSLRLDDVVADAIPGFGENGKGHVRVGQLLTHTAGFPRASMDPLEWEDRERRLARFASWRLEWSPGSRFVYHGTSSMWVLAQLIEAKSGRDFREFLRLRVSGPLGLPDLYLGLPAEENRRVADVVPVGAPPGEGEPGQLLVDAPAIPDEEYARFNRPEVRAVGTPGGGVVTTAAAVALFYQALLRDAKGEGPGIWDSGQLAQAFRPHTGELLDPMTKQKANRGLGLVVAGNEGRVFRGFAQACSPRSIGHMGAGGQVAWADPNSGLSFAYVTNGAWRNPLRQGAEGLALSRLAASVLDGAG